MIRKIRTQVFWTVVGLTIAFAVLGRWWPWTRWGLVATIPLIILGLWDLAQRRHNLLRNYPLVGHLRYLIEGTGAELRQYIVESNIEGKPFNRDQRSLIYQRAKNVSDKKPFGTELPIYEPGFAWLGHAMVPKPVARDAVAAFRVDVGGRDCTTPYSASVYNISAMSFGSLSGPAILALNKGAAMGDFAHNTGEGGLSRYHRKHGGGVFWQIGTGYFGCRTDDGRFNPDKFAEQAVLEQVKMIEIKLSQGAKPGHGGILPGKKVSPEIAEARHVPAGEDCISPSAHTAFGTPIGLLEYVRELRELSGGKPIGFKMCIGRPEEVFGIFKAMIETDVMPDFITVDGAEGGTGAAPIEFSDHMGLPLKEALVLVHNALVGMNARPRVKVIASGKLISGFDIAAAMALGADMANTARGFMFALGCIQAQSCHTNECPVGVATQNPRLARAIHVPDKAERVRSFHHNTVHALAEVVGAMGLEHPSEITPNHLYQRTSATEIRSYADLYSFIEPGQLLDGHAGDNLQRFWDVARADSFAASAPVALRR